MSSRIPVTNADQYTDLYEKREKIYNRYVTGRFQWARAVTLWVTLGIYFVGPWVNWGGRQAVLFDLPERKFHIFFLTFWPQDFVLLSWMLIIAAFALFFFTALAGRLWCGYTCPQTAWTEFFMWIEYKIEGDRNKRIKLDKADLTWSKLWRKAAKHTSWVLVALITGFTFVGYFTPMRELFAEFFLFESNGWAYFWIGFFTLATYINAGWMREQVCLYMCPYARFQSAMFDRNTWIVTYDHRRGEPRGKRGKKANKDAISEGDKAAAGDAVIKGDCIDCDWCVQVCPTGIDIRDGLQYECIGCAACIDACDQVMLRVGSPTGLIRYSTENEMEGKSTKIIRPRIVVYSLLLTLFCSLFLYALISRVPLKLDVIRDRKALATQTLDQRLENVYTLKVINMVDAPQSYEVLVDGIDGIAIKGAPKIVNVAAGQVADVGVRVSVATDAVKTMSTPIEFTVVNTNDSELEASKESRFIAPENLRQ